MAPSPTQPLSCDIAIIGGGIAGLWLLNRLTSAGYNTVLFEQTALGNDQTVASQGMIHGGIKYTLGGALTGASEAIADMPDHWRACLAGEGDVDLRGANTLSDHFYLWSSSSALSRMSTFLASKATRGRVIKVGKKDRPSLFQHPDFSGSLYQLVDMVLDVPSVVKKLADNCAERIFRIDWQQARWLRQPDKSVAIEFDYDGQAFNLTARQVVLAAGQGNEALLSELGIRSPQMQRRPLQQVMIKHHHPHRFYGHCLGAETTPRLTISSHPCEDGSQVWYLGGTLAEKGATQRPDELIECAKRELADLMPWVDFSSARWATLPVDRAEPRQRNFARPDKAFASRAEGCDNVIVAWPTKLTLCPNLADEVMALLERLGISPSDSPLPKLDFLERPPLAPTPWQTAFGD
ncbi:MAG: FAD-dependent oxidoreductase [Gammaproteobacteria bacterium]|nr:MAG: FAD-dependent oxidoreductase [Gammaproteobacteria bacterium]